MKAYILTAAMLLAVPSWAQAQSKPQYNQADHDPMLRQAQRSRYSVADKMRLGAAACVTKACRCALENGGEWKTDGTWYINGTFKGYQVCLNK